MGEAIARHHVAKLAYAFGIAVKIRKGHYSQEDTNHRKIKSIVIDSTHMGTHMRRRNEWLFLICDSVC
jgi:hypothetical protein